MATPDSIGPDYDSLDETGEEMADEAEVAGLSPEQSMLVEQAGLDEAQGIALVELIRSVQSEDPYADTLDTELA